LSKTEHIPKREFDESLTFDTQTENINKIKNKVSVHNDEDCTEIKDLEGMDNDSESYHDDKNDPSWLDNSNPESDEENIDAIQNFINSETKIIEESIKEEEEIDEFIQKEFVMQKEDKEKELVNASKLLEGAVKDLNHKNEEFRKIVDSNNDIHSESSSLLDHNIGNSLKNDNLKSDEDDAKKGDKESERSLSEARGDTRYMPDPFLPEGWKQASYFMKKTGIETHKYMSPDGQKFTSRKLMIFFMKTKGYSQEVLDRVMEGTKCKRRAKGLPPGEDGVDDPPAEVQKKKVVKERFITNQNNGKNDKEAKKRKREDVTDKVNGSHPYNEDNSTNDEAFNEGEKKRKRGRPRKDDKVEMNNKDPMSEPILEPINVSEDTTPPMMEPRPEPRPELIWEPVDKITETPPMMDTLATKSHEQSAIGPKITISRAAYGKLSELFLKSPIPSNSELASISKSTEVSAKDVKWWFIKIRHKVKVNKVEKEMVKNYLDSISICQSKNGIVSL